MQYLQLSDHSRLWGFLDNNPTGAQDLFGFAGSNVSPIQFFSDRRSLIAHATRLVGARQ